MSEVKSKESRRIFVAPTDLSKAAAYIRRRYGNVLITVRPCSGTVVLSWQA